jgi:hypothetical protein
VSKKGVAGVKEYTDHDSEVPLSACYAGELNVATHMYGSTTNPTIAGYIQIAAAYIPRRSLEFPSVNDSTGAILHFGDEFGCTVLPYAAAGEKALAGIAETHKYNGW